MEIRINPKYLITYEYWHKGIDLSVQISMQTVAKECNNCESYDLDIISFSSNNPGHGDITVTFFCRDCDNIEKIQYPIVSRKRVEKFDPSKDKIDFLMEKDLTFL